MFPANSPEILHDQLVALNRALKLSSEEKVTQAGRTWVFRKDQEAIPLSLIQKIIPKNLKLDNQQENLRSAVELLQKQVQRLYEDTPAKQVVLQRLSDLLPTRAEAMLDEIELGLSPDCFDPFERNEHGMLIKPEEQLERFRTLLNSNPLHLELTDTAEKPLTAQDYIQAAKRVVDHDFIVTFRTHLPPELRMESRAKEAREYMQSIAYQIPLFNIAIVDTDMQTTIPPELAKCSHLKNVSFTGANFHFLRALLNHENLTNIQFSGYDGYAVPDWVYSMHQLKFLDAGNLKFDSHLLSQLDRLWVGTMLEKRKDPLPPELFEMHHLKLLKLTNVSSETLPAALGNLNKLEQLEIIHNEFRTLPAEIGKLSALKSLFISMNPNLSQLPAEIGKLHNLEDLSLFGSFETLPDEIGDLPKLKSIRLSTDYLLQLPDSIGNLKALETIECEEHHLHLLPDSLVNCSKLQKIAGRDGTIYWSKEGDIPLADFLKAARKRPERQP